MMLCVARWSFVITPLNYNLAAANIFVAGTNMYQLSRVYRAGLLTEKTGGLAEALEKKSIA